MKATILAMMLLVTATFALSATPAASACGIKDFKQIGDCLDERAAEATAVVNAGARIGIALLMKVYCANDPMAPECQDG